MNRSWVIAVVVALVIIVICCLCWLLIFGASTFMIWDAQTSDGPQTILITPFEIDPLVSPTERPSPTPRPTRTPMQLATEQPTPEAGSTPQPTVINTGAGGPEETLRTLKEAQVPVNDPVELARRLEGKDGIPLTLEPPLEPRQVGDRQSFWVSDTETNDNFKVDATLRFVTDHAYFWIQNSVNYNAGDLRRLAETFEREIYPTNREFFGDEWSPGVDGDVHLYILYAEGLGSGIAGYFSSLDSYNPAINEYSNGHEMFVFNADNVDFDEEFTYGVLAHEFQHMIHWYRDRNEETWLNEGFSDLAMFLNDYSIGGHDWVYADDPDLQLNDWPNDSGATTPHYGAAFLFVNYFLDRLGEIATQALVAEPENGLDSIDKVLADLNATDPLTGQTVGADDIFIDWVLANFLLDPRVSDGRFDYRDYDEAPLAAETEEIFDCTDQPEERSVSQYGVDYIRIRCDGVYTLHFEGVEQVAVLPENALSGAYAFWSNKGDESDITLTQEFDFRDLSGPLTLKYWTWYDIEEDFDYLYLVASTDGDTWQILETPSGTADDPTGANFGWGYNHLSGGGPHWIEEEVDISQYVGQVVQLRFEYITDAAVNGEGFLLDDVSIPEISYFTDFESDDGGWIADGFVRIQNVLPQTYRLALIKTGRQTTVEYISLDSDNRVTIPLDLGGEVDDVVLVVTGTTRFTRQPADYQFSFTP